MAVVSPEGVIEFSVPSATRATAMHLAVAIVDRDPGDTRAVRVGEATLPADAARTELLVADCGPSAPVRVGEEAIGTWYASATATLVAPMLARHPEVRDQAAAAMTARGFSTAFL